jgi:hypothetical protein
MGVANNPSADSPPLAVITVRIASPFLTGAGLQYPELRSNVFGLRSSYVRADHANLRNEVFDGKPVGEPLLPYAQLVKLLAPAARG